MTAFQRGFLARAQTRPFLALEHFELALLNHPDHPSATVGLCNILLEVAAQELAPVSTTASLDSLLASLSLHSASPTFDPQYHTSPTEPSPVNPGPLGFAPTNSTNSTGATTADHAASGDHAVDRTVDRLAARDRAYVLLKTLTEQGSGWDFSEAWFALARALELSGLEARATEALWWCVQLEDSRPVRPWDCVNGKGYVL